MKDSRDFSERKDESKKVDKEDKWLICVDPDSYQIYTFNRRDNDFTLEDIVPEEYREKAKQDIKQIKSKLMFDQGVWMFESAQSKEYRRRPLPSYIDISHISQYPMYLCQSSLSLAFADISTIEVEIDFSKYRSVFEMNRRSRKSYKIFLTVDLVSG